MSGTGDVGGTGDTEVKGDYTATEKVKTLMMKEGALDEKGAVLDYTCGEFFMRKYSLYLYRGCIMVIPYIRHDGIWKWMQIFIIMVDLFINRQT